jgi:hypothetical protein
MRIRACHPGIAPYNAPSLPRGGFISGFLARLRLFKNATIKQFVWALV